MAWLTESAYLTLDVLKRLGVALAQHFNLPSESPELQVVKACLTDSTKVQGAHTGPPLFNLCILLSSLLQAQAL